jgi:hypothetical protein
MTKLKEDAVKAIRNLHADNSVDLPTTLCALEEVMEEVGSLIECIKDDMR